MFHYKVIVIFLKSKSDRVLEINFYEKWEAFLLTIKQFLLHIKVK